MVAVVVVLCTFWSRGHALRVTSCTEEEEGPGGRRWPGPAQVAGLAAAPHNFFFFCSFSFFLFF